MVHVAVNKAVEKQRVTTDKMVALITIVANKMTGRWNTVKKRDIEICDINKTKLVNNI